MVDMSPVLQLLRHDNFLLLSKPLMFALGNDAAILFIELITRHAYFHERNMLTQDQYFYSTMIDLQRATNLTPYQQRRAIAHLSKLGLIKVDVRGQQPKRFFWVNGDPDVILYYVQIGTEKIFSLTNDAESEETSHLKVKKLNFHIRKKKNNGADASENSQFCPECLTEMVAGDKLSYHSCMKRHTKD